MAQDFVTAEQVEAAREVDLVDYLHKTEPGNIIPSAPGEYRLKDHDSLKISNGKFHWFSRGIGGTNAIDYLVKVRDMEFKDAVRELAGDDFSSVYQPQTQSSHPHPKSKPADRQMKPKEQDGERIFVLPGAEAHNSDVIEYLKGRGIEESIIISCIENKLLYQSTKQSCVFVGYDADNVPKFASERAIKSGHKKDVSGSDKAHSFTLPPIIRDLSGNGRINPQNTYGRLYVFEGPVDCISHASIAVIGDTDWDGYRLSLGGVSSMALNKFLENNSYISQVYLCLDNDVRGNEAAQRISQELLGNEKYSHINIYIAPPPIGKDFNDTLMYMREKAMERKLQHGIGDSPAANKPEVGKRRSGMTL